MGDAAERRWEPLTAEAERRRMSPRALRDFCKRYNVPICGTTRNQQVKPADIDAALDRQAKLRMKIETDETAMSDILATTKVPGRMCG